jgi:FAD/FMN-containing dehydrogenase
VYVQVSGDELLLDNRRDKARREVMRKVIESTLVSIDGAGEGLTELRRSLGGTVLAPADAGFDAARRCFNTLVDRRPAVIVRCLDAGDVARAFDFARAHALEVAVRGGGHNPAGHCVCDGGLVIDLSLMRGVDVNGDARTACADGGARWLDFDAATQRFGLVTPGGVVGSTGVAGLTLGGGIGHLTAQHGLTCDNLVGAELVTPNGTVVRASPDENPELLWGLRGGGGNFGVATRLEFRLHPLRRVLGGRLTYAGTGVRDALRRFRDLAARAPRDLSCEAVLGLDGSLAPALIVAPCYTGPDGDPGELRTLRTARGLAHDAVRAQSFLAQQHVFNPGYGADRNYWKGHFVRELPDELIDELIERMVALGRPPGQVLIESLHGAPKDVDRASAALGFRDAAFNISVMAAWLDAALDEQSIKWARATAAALEPWSVSGGYMNYMQADEPIERVRAAFGDEAFERLRTLKRRYDPDNVLRRNQNIPPL